MKKTVAIFPIPNFITFPGTAAPLHVFEPRYRKMITDCIEKQIELAVAMPQKTVSAVDTSQLSKEEVLSTNLSSYKTHSVACCGPVTLREEMKDGRLLVDVIFTQRCEITSIQQYLPYYLGEATILDEESIAPERIDGYLTSLIDVLERAAKKTIDRSSLIKPNEEESGLISLFVWLVENLPFSSELKQELLELPGYGARIEQLLTIVGHKPPTSAPKEEKPKRPTGIVRLVPPIEQDPASP